MEINTIGIDIGGTRVKGVLVDGTGNILEKVTEETNDQGGGSTWKETVVKVLAKLKEKSERGTVVGISAPGLADQDNRSIAFMPGRLSGLEGLVWKDYLGHEKVFVLNDAHAALLAESKLGAGKGVENMVLLTLGTGVGGGILINGQLYTGFEGIAGHMGHITVNADSPWQDVTNMPGSLEEAIGEVSVSKRSYGRFLNTEELVAGYKQGDALATLVWLNSVRHLAVGLASLCNTLSPELILIGGGISKAGASLFGPLNDFMDLFEWRPGGKKVRIEKAEFGEFAGAIGAAVFGFEKS